MRLSSRAEKYREHFRLIISRGKMNGIQPPSVLMIGIGSIPKEKL